MGIYANGEQSRTIHVQHIGRYAARRSAVRGCGFVVSRGLALRGGLIFSHPMPLGIGHQFYGFVDAFFHRALGIKYLVS